MSKDAPGAAEFMLREYTVLRSEIDVYHGQQKDLTHFAVLGSIALAGLSLRAKEDLYDSRLLFLLAPLLFLMLAFIYADRMIRILRVADYIHNDLRIRASMLLSKDRETEVPVIWEWEIFKRRIRRYPKAVVLLLDWTRWLVFLVPGFGSLGAFLFLRSGHPWMAWEVVGLAIVPAVLVLASVLILFIEESTGIDSDDLLKRAVAHGALEHRREPAD